MLMILVVRMLYVRVWLSISSMSKSWVCRIVMLITSGITLFKR